MDDPYYEFAASLVTAGIINTGDDMTTLVARVREFTTHLYLTALTAGAAQERTRVLGLVHAIVDNAAGDRQLGLNILKKLEGK